MVEMKSGDPELSSGPTVADMGNAGGPNHRSYFAHTGRKPRFLTQNWHRGFRTLGNTLFKIYTEQGYVTCTTFSFDVACDECHFNITHLQMRVGIKHVKIDPVYRRERAALL